MINFLLQNFKKIFKILKNKISEYGDEDEENKFKDFFKKLKEKKLKISRDKLENLLKEKYGIIREKNSSFHYF